MKRYRKKKIIAWEILGGTRYRVNKKFNWKELKNCTRVDIKVQVTYAFTRMRHEVAETQRIISLPLI